MPEGSVLNFEDKTLSVKSSSSIENYTYLSLDNISSIKVFEQMLGAQQFVKSATFICNQLLPIPNENLAQRYVNMYFHSMIMKLLVSQSFNQSKLSQTKSLEFNVHFALVCQSFIKKHKDFMPDDSINWVESIPDIAQNILTFAKDISEHNLQVEIHGILWDYYNKKGNHEEAEVNVKSALKLLAKNNHIKKQAELYSKLATSLMRQSKYTASLFYFRQALVAAKNLGENKALSDAYFNLSYYYREMGQLALAKRYIEYSLKIDLSSLKFVKVDEGKSCISTNKPFLVRNSAMYSQLNNASMSMIQIGKVQRALGNYELSKTYIECASEILKSSDDYYKFVSIIELNKAEILLDKTYQLSDEFNDLIDSESLEESQVLVAWLLRLESALNRHDDSYFNFVIKQLLVLFDSDVRVDEKAKSINDVVLKSIQNDNKIRKIEFFRLLMKHAARNQESHLVKEYGNKGMSLIESLVLHERSAKAWFNVQYQFVDDYINALLIQTQETSQNKTEIIFSLLEKLTSSNSIKNNSYQFFSGELDLNLELKELSGNRLNEKKELVATAEENKARRRIRVDTADEFFRANTETAAKLVRQKIKHLPIEKIQQVIQSNELYLRYFINDENAILICITKRKVWLKFIPPKSKIEKNIDQLVSYIANEPTVPLAKIRSLSQLLPLKLMQREKITRLIVTPDSVLAKLPFSIINVSLNPNVYLPLVNEVEITYTMSASDYFSSTKKKIDTSEQSIAIFANPAINKAELKESKGDFLHWYLSLQKLPYTEYEAKSIAGMFDNAILGIGESATSEFLLSEQVRKSNIIHIATHGYYNSETPEILGLITSLNTKNNTGGFLSLEQIMSKPYDAELVVLNGCETLMGKYYRGSGYRSLVLGFLSQGANAVLGTLWKIGDQPSAHFMNIFYKNYRKFNYNYIVALQKTQNEMRSSSLYSHPRYWAAYVLYMTENIQ